MFATSVAASARRAAARQPHLRRAHRAVDRLRPGRRGRRAHPPGAPARHAIAILARVRKNPSSVLEAVEAVLPPLAARALGAPRRACRGAARRDVGAARGVAPGQPRRSTSRRPAGTWRAALRSPRPALQCPSCATESLRRTAPVPAARPPTPRGARLAEADHFVSHYEVGLDERGQPPAGTSVAFAYCDPRAPGFAQELEAMLFRGAPARHTLAVALRYRPASRRADEPLHLQGFGAKLALKRQRAQHARQERRARRRRRRRRRGGGRRRRLGEAVVAPPQTRPRARERSRRSGSPTSASRRPSSSSARSVRSPRCATPRRTCPRSRARWRRRRSRRRRPRRCERRSTLSRCR